MKKGLKLCLLAAIIIGIISLIFIKVSGILQEKNISDVSDEEVNSNFAKMFKEGFIINDINVPVLKYEVETLDGDRRLKIVYKTQYSEKENEKEQLFAENKTIFNGISSKSFFKENVDRIWLLGMNGNNYVINKSYNVVTSHDKYFIKIIYTILLTFTVFITLAFRSAYLNRKRNKKLGGQKLEDYSLEELVSYVEKNKTDDEAFYYIAILQSNKGAYEEAIQSIKTAMMLDNRCLEYRRMAGKICYNSGDYKQAVKYLKGSTAIDTAVNDYEYYYEIGRAYCKLEDIKKAEKSFDKAKKIIKKQFSGKAAEEKMLLDKIDSILAKYCR